MTLFTDLEDSPRGTRVALDELLDALPYNEQGLIAAVAQDAGSREVLMLAWMNRTAIETTLREGVACYYSRSRQTLWRKGESSGHVQKVLDLRFDCDGDAILLTVEQTGPACHTNRPACFYLQVQDQEVVVVTAPESG